MSTFATLLRQHRKRRRWSMERLALEANISHTLISRIEKGGLEAGGRNPTHKNIAAIADALGLGHADRDGLYLVAGFVPPDLDLGPLARFIAQLREAKEQPTRGDLAA